MENIKLPFRLEIPLKEIIYMESESNYTQIYVDSDKKKIIASKSLCHVTAGIDTQAFIRINRSQVINIAYIKKYLDFNNFALITLKNGQVLRTSRRRKDYFLKVISL
ncbi:LytTR family DNA-binding domain-containing protein [uncultured Arcticibacterium sp.]|uniref:LytR/AlgR family response regulator transcription factor n=1 Tax=uncultured Arcticibacterium sp. TaxID=2173042 RepID=UPI0030F58E6F